MAYQPDKSRHDCPPLLAAALKEKRHRVVCAGVSDFFPSVDHDVLDRLLKDPPFPSSLPIRQLIRSFPLVRVMEDGRLEHSPQGISCANSYSRILSNLHGLDQAFSDQLYCSQVDDAVILDKTERKPRAGWAGPSSRSRENGVRKLRLDRVGELRVDCLIDGRRVREAKQAAALTAGHESQVCGYLRATGVKRGVLLSFRPARLQTEWSA